METYYAWDGEHIREFRLPKSEVKNNKWVGVGYKVATTLNKLITLINRGE